ncbi:MAG: ribonuclease III [Dehalococcoidia bacterium]|nr:MAG: ribonuclease III [Dehalococcoidia bacterium]
MSSISKFESSIEISFNNKALLTQAFRHSSYLNENPDTGLHDNQRMEFLGDSLLNFIIAEKLFHEFPDLPEGKLTEIRVSLVRQEKLAEKAAVIKLGDSMQLGKGEDLSGGRNKRNNLADTFEALIAAIFLDQGIEATRDFILKYFTDDVTAIKSGQIAPNYKAMLQELTQAEYKLLPEYEVVEAQGPDHNRIFVVSVSVSDTVIAIGSGKSKKLAESEAARIALSRLSDKSENQA